MVMGVLAIATIASCCDTTKPKPRPDTVLCKDPLAMYDSGTDCHCPATYYWDSVQCQPLGMQLGGPHHLFKGYEHCNDWRDSLYLVYGDTINNTLNIVRKTSVGESQYGTAFIGISRVHPLVDSFSCALVTLATAGTINIVAKDVAFWGTIKKTRVSAFVRFYNTYIDSLGLHRTDGCDVVFDKIY
jgi:hypothetical protein